MPTTDMGKHRGSHRTPSVHIHPATGTYHCNVRRPDGRRRKLNLRTKDQVEAESILRRKVLPSLGEGNVLPDDFDLDNPSAPAPRSKPRPRMYQTGRRWMVSCYDHLGARRTVHLGMVGDEENAQAVYRMLCDVLDGQNRLPPGFTLRALRSADPSRQRVADVFDAFQRSHRFASYSDKERDQMRHVMAEAGKVLGHVPLGELKPAQIVHLRDRVWGGKGLAWTTVQAKTRKLKTVFSLSQEQGWCPPEVWTMLRGVKNMPSAEAADVTDEREKFTPTEEELELVLAQLHGCWRLAALLQAQNALRISEVAAISHESIAIEGDDWVFRPKRHKSSHRRKRRETYLSQESIAALRPLALRYNGADAWVNTDGTSPRHRGDAVTSKGMNSALERACEAAGVERFTSHALRRVALCRAMQFGGEHAARLLAGHSSEEVTRIYLERVERQKRRELARKMG